MIYFALSFLSLCAEEILSTKEGGVIQVGDVRLQGREVTLSKENGEDILHIKGDVLVVQNKKFLIGEELTYNMSKKEGTLTNGTYFVDKYFLGGKKITLSETGALQIEEGYATTSPDKEFPWAVQAKQINLSETSRMQATEIKPSAFNTPFFFLPSYSMALQKDPNRPEPPLPVPICLGKWPRSYHPPLKTNGSIGMEALRPRRIPHYARRRCGP